MDKRHATEGGEAGVTEGAGEAGAEAELAGLQRAKDKADDSQEAAMRALAAENQVGVPAGGGGGCRQVAATDCACVRARRPPAPPRSCLLLAPGTVASTPTPAFDARSPQPRTPNPQP